MKTKQRNLKRIGHYYGYEILIDLSDLKQGAEQEVLLSNAEALLFDAYALRDLMKLLKEQLDKIDLNVPMNRHHYSLLLHGRSKHRKFP